MRTRTPHGVGQGQTEGQTEGRLCILQHWAHTQGLSERLVSQT
jgi:hypothetical protein